METFLYTLGEEDNDVLCALTTNSKVSAAEIDEMVRCGFTSKEIMALLKLLQCYQADGGDIGTIIRHWEFLKLLVQSGRIEAA